MTRLHLSAPEISALGTARRWEIHALDKGANSSRGGVEGHARFIVPKMGFATPEGRDGTGSQQSGRPRAVTPTAGVESGPRETSFPRRHRASLQTTSAVMEPNDTHSPASASLSRAGAGAGGLLNMALLRLSEKEDGASQHDLASRRTG